MDDDMVYIDIAFMILVVILSIYQIYFSNSFKELSDDLKSPALMNIIKYLYFIAITSFFANMFFDLDWMLFVTLFSVLGLGLIDLKPAINKKTVIFIIIEGFIFITFNVPKHPGSFEKYINDKGEDRCLSIDCVKITESISPDGNLYTKVHILEIEQSTFDCYLLFAKGSLVLKDEKEDNYEEIEGINIGGLWFVND